MPSSRRLPIFKWSRSILRNHANHNYLFLLHFVIHYVRDVGVAGSNSVTLTIDSARVFQTSASNGSGASAGRSRRIRPLSKRGRRMTKPIARDPMYRRRSFDADIIELCVRWYISYRLSYPDLVAMMAERGVEGLTHDDFTMGRSVCSRVREAMESTCTPHRLVLAGRRDIRLHSRQMALPVSSCG